MSIRNLFQANQFDLYSKSLTTSGVNFGQETLNDYEEFSVGLTFTGPASFSGTARITKIGRQVLIQLQPFSVLTTSSNFITSNIFLPNSSFYPLSPVYYMALMNVGANVIPVRITILTTGGMAITMSAVSGANLTTDALFPNATTIAIVGTANIVYSV